MQRYTATQLKDAVQWMTAATLPIKQLELVLELVVELQRRIDREGNAVVEWTATDEAAAKTVDQSKICEVLKSL